ncbi:dephospho-CoA kinase [Alphaproteobacteria bacterium]|nr:dephospho-CoA kinase [Alphaproteobacteria bacterium]
MKIAITGNIGSGKSEAIKFLILKGYKCISSDQIIKSLYQDKNSREYILKRMNLSHKNYKKEIIKKLSNNIFNKNLKKVIYPMLYAKKKIIAPKFDNFIPIFYEVPLLFEENLAQDFDGTIFINSNILIRKKRVLQRGVTEQYFHLMNQKQLKENIKKNLSDLTIDNNGSILNLRLNIIKLLQSL